MMEYSVPAVTTRVKKFKCKTETLTMFRTPIDQFAAVIEIQIIPRQHVTTTSVDTAVTQMVADQIHKLIRKLLSILQPKLINTSKLLSILQTKFINTSKLLSILQTKLRTRSLLIIQSQMQDRTVKQS